MPHEQTRNRRRARVLVVDDDLASRILAALLLEKAGYSPTAVATVRRALERIDEEGTDLVLTDLMLPGESGLDLCSSERRSAGFRPPLDTRPAF